MKAKRVLINYSRAETLHSGSVFSHLKFFRHTHPHRLRQNVKETPNNVSGGGGLAAEA